MLFPSRNSLLHRLFALVICLIALGTNCGDLEAKDAQKESAKGHDIFIFSDFAGNREVPEWKSAGAIQGWEKELGEKIGEEIRISIVSCELGIAGLEMMGKPSVAIIPAVEKDRCKGMLPEFLVEQHEGLYSNFMLLAPGSSQVTDKVATLRVGLLDATIMMPWNGRLWANSILPDLDLASIRAVQGSDHVVIPVFFGHAAYGIIDQDGFEAEVRRNPQVKEQIRVIAESPPMLGNAVFIREDLSLSVAEKIRRELVRSSKGENGAVVFDVLGWHALRPVTEKEEMLISESIAVLTGESGNDATAEAKAKGAKK